MSFWHRNLQLWRFSLVQSRFMFNCPGRWVIFVQQLKQTQRESHRKRMSGRREQQHKWGKCCLIMSRRCFLREERHHVCVSETHWALLVLTAVNLLLPLLLYPPHVLYTPSVFLFSPHFTSPSHHVVAMSTQIEQRNLFGLSECQTDPVSLLLIWW